MGIGCASASAEFAGADRVEWPHRVARRALVFYCELNLQICFNFESSLSPLVSQVSCCTGGAEQNLLALQNSNFLTHERMFGAGLTATAYFKTAQFCYSCSSIHKLNGELTISNLIIPRTKAKAVCTVCIPTIDQVFTHMFISEIMSSEQWSEKSGPTSGSCYWQHSGLSGPVFFAA
jgi:hypothetical protein